MELTKNYLNKNIQDVKQRQLHQRVYPNLFNGQSPKLMGQLNIDTVAFSGTRKTKNEQSSFEEDLNKTQTNKKMGLRSGSVNFKLAKILREEAITEHKQLMNTLKRYFSGLISTETTPGRPLAYGKSGIVSRVKGNESIIEKTATINASNKTDVKENMSDLIGARLVLRDASKASVEQVMSKLIEAVKNNDLKIFEIENYSPSEKYSYVSNKQLDKLEEACNKVRTNGVTRKNVAVPSGYTGVHFSVYLNNGFRAEIQLMGEDVQRVKDVEDFIYKIKNGKDLPEKYKVIQKILEPLRDNKPLQKAMTVHSYEQYIYAREIEPKTSKKSKQAKFLPLPKYFAPEFDFNYLYELKQKCDREAKHS